MTVYVKCNSEQDKQQAVKSIMYKHFEILIKKKLYKLFLRMRDKAKNTLRKTFPKL